jgi:tRNA-guanine family transglycosylase
MNWNGPIFTDSGGFQVFSLGIAYKKGIDAVSHTQKGDASQAKTSSTQLARVTDEGVTFRSHLDGAKLVMTPENSMETQHQIGADIHMHGLSEVLRGMMSSTNRIGTLASRSRHYMELFRAPAKRT